MDLDCLKVFVQPKYHFMQQNSVMDFNKITIPLHLNHVATLPSELLLSNTSISSLSCVLEHFCRNNSPRVVTCGWYGRQQLHSCSTYYARLLLLIYCMDFLALFVIIINNFHMDTLEQVSDLDKYWVLCTYIDLLQIQQTELLIILDMPSALYIVW